MLGAVRRARGPEGGGGLDYNTGPTTAERLAKAHKSIDANDWAGAQRELTSMLREEPRNAEVHNMLGYVYRKGPTPNLPKAFEHYERAIYLDPKHKGAHEYIGEAYLLVGNLAKAKEHLAALDKLCFFSCEEYRDLKKAVQEYEARKK